MSIKKRDTEPAERRVKPKTTPNEVPYLGRILEMSPPVLEAFFDLKMVLLLRETSTNYNNGLDPRRTIRFRKLWSRVQPPLWKFIPQIPTMSSTSADMFASVYKGEQSYEYEKLLIEIACPTGNLALVKRHWENTRDYFNLIDNTGKAAQYGQIAVLSWLMEQKELHEAKFPNFRIGKYLSRLRSAACNGDIMVAEWHLANGVELWSDEGGFDLLKIACACEQYKFAEWVLGRFPTSPSSSELSNFIYNNMYTASFLTKAFDLGWEELRDVYAALWTDDDNGELEPGLHDTFKWLGRRFKAEINQDIEEYFTRSGTAAPNH